MPQYVLVDRPVILSKHKRNVISHGRPLDPIGSLRSISPYVPRQVVKGPFIQEKHGDTLPLKLPRSAATVSLTEYQKSAQENLISINNNLSTMLQETFSGIDKICQKVRLCLMEGNVVNTLDVPEHFVQLKSRIDTGQPLSTCEGGDTPNISHNAEESIAELTEENEIEHISVKNNEANEVKQLKTTDKSKRISSLTPFVTILNPKTQSAEITSISSKLGFSRKCNGENFQKTMIEVDKLANYEKFLTSMVDDVDKEISKCYINCQKNSDDTIKCQDNKVKNSLTNKDKRPQSSPVMEGQPRNIRDLFHYEAVKRVHELKKFQKDINEDNSFDNDLLSCDLIGRVGRRNALCLYPGQTDFSYADVYRKRAITDLHKRMVAQVEANDSLIFFQKLMKKNKKYLDKNRPTITGDVGIGDQSPECSSSKTPMHDLSTEKRHGRKQRSIANLPKKYQDSLWFKQRKHETKRAKRESKGKKKRGKKSSKNENCLPQSYTVQSVFTLHGKPSQKSKENVQGEPCNCKVSVINDRPLSESEKCKIHWMRARYSQLTQKKLKYLDILDDITKKDLIPLKAEYPRRDAIVKISDVKDSYLYKLLHGKNNKKAWMELLEPTSKCSKENCQNCSNINISERQDDQKENEHKTRSTDSTPCINPGKRHIIRTLSKYIFSELPNSNIANNVFTVMPVHVFYDNPRIGGTNRRQDVMPQKLPLLPMKETKDSIKKAEWMAENTKKTKPMKVVYDPILRKIDQEIRMVSARQENRTASSHLAATNSWSPKHFNQYLPPHRQMPGMRNISANIIALDKASQRIPQHRTIASSRTPVAELFKRSPKAPLEQPIPYSTGSPVWNSQSFDPIAYQKDMDVKRKIKKDVEQATKIKKDQERKIWQNKYGKSAGQKLLNFIEKQPTAYQTPVPKYALPKTTKDSSKRQKQMLDQLHTLKQKNDHIQTNIQKAIGVIENKMVDVMGKPATSQSIEVFDEMEREITNVLSMMKMSNPQEGTLAKKNPTKDEDYVSDVDKISEELFRKLDKILESPGISSGRSSKHSIIVHEDNLKKKRKQKSSRTPVKSSDMNQVCFSSTSASGEEKFTITAISPKRPFRNPMMPPFIRTSNSDDAATENEVTNISSELRKLRKELQLDESFEELKPTEMMKVLEAIDESKISKDAVPNKNIAVMLKKKKIIPVQEQVVNLAMVKTNQECSAGDQLTGLNSLLLTPQTPTKIDTDDEPSYSIGDGDSVALPDNFCKKINNNENKLSETPEEPRTPEGTSVEESPTSNEKEPQASPHRVQEMEVHYQEAVQIEKQPLDVIEISDPYFTPNTSPITGTRDTEYLQQNSSTIVRNEINLQNQENLNHEIAEVNELEDIKHSPSSQETKTISPKNGCKKEDDISSDDLKSTENIDDDKSTETSTERACFYQNVNKLISRVESVYNQLEEFEEMLSEESQDPTPKIAVFQAPPKVEEPKTDDFLTPFMHALKDMRNPVPPSPPSSRKARPKVQRSPSYFNVLNFLDNLTDFKEERPIEVRTSRSKIVIRRNNCKPLGYKKCTCSTSELSIPKKKSGCLKIPSSQMNMNTSVSKSKQKVSFLLQKEEKATQVTACPIHNSTRTSNHCNPEDKVSTDTSTHSAKKDEQVSAYLDAMENRSVDQISLINDENTCQSTLEFSDEMSSDKYQMPEQIIQKDQDSCKKIENTTENRKHVVELYRKNSSEEKGREKVKVFYDNYQKGQNNLNTNLITGFYNESSISQVKQSLDKDIAIKKRDSLEKLSNKLHPEALLTELLKETSLFEPLKNVNSFIDSKLLKEAIGQRQKIRMMRRKSSCSLISNKKEKGEISHETKNVGDKENFLKGIYVFVYLLMFTALNLEYKCVQ